MAACALANSHWQTSGNRTEGKAIILRSFASLAISKEEYRAVLEACLPSEMARRYLLDSFAIHAFRICDIIWGAPISLYKKAELLGFLASREYRLRVYEKPIESNEEIFLEVKDWLDGDPERGKALWEADYRAAKGEMTDEDIYELLLKAEQIIAAQHGRGA